MSVSSRPPTLREALVQSGLLSEAALTAAPAGQRAPGKRPGGLPPPPPSPRPAVPEHALMRALGAMLGLEVCPLGARDVAPDVLSRVPSEFALTRQVLPLSVAEGALTVAVA